MTVLTYGRVYEDCTEKELEYVQAAMYCSTYAVLA